MAERIEVQVPDGTADALLFRADGPTVVFYMDAGGLRPAMTAMAERLQAAGYTVLQPNLYWRSGPFAPFDFGTVFTDPAERDRLFGLLRTVRAADVVADTRAWLDHLGIERAGTVGYCLGGRAAFVVASALGERIAAGASIHGGGLVTDADDSPHRGAAGVRGELYFAVADHDNGCTAAHQATLREALDAAGVRYQLELYEGARHGFAVPDAPVFDAAAAERHYERVLALFGRALPR
ncbi:MAG: dienelactone hydrolase family protein [Myxococcota bacterium]